MKLYRSIFLASALAVFSFEASAQDFNKIFEDFVKSNQQEFEDFRQKANLEYAEFMRKGWEWFEGKDPITPPVQEEPVVPPVVVPEEDLEKDLQEKEIPYQEVIEEPQPAPAPEPIAPIEEPPMPVDSKLDFNLYGTRCSVRYDVAARPTIRAVSEDGLADYWEDLSRSKDINDLLYDMMRQREEMSLCDWGYYKYTEALSNAVYPSLENEAALFQAFLLIQSGFKLKIGIGEDDLVYLLMAAQCDIYDFPYYEIQGENYYMINDRGADRVKILADSFPATMHPMRLDIDQENLFNVDLTQARRLSSERYPSVSVEVMTNKNLIDFFNDYPLAFVNNDMRTKWRFYANVPISRSVRETLYPSLKRSVMGKTELDAVNILLNFVQTAFEYEYDEEIWGEDRSFFADESLYYPFCDCEDRSILFSRLVRDLIGLNIVLIYYPGHLATAVKFNQEVTGDYITYGGSRYTICDPTYINAPVGMTMPDMDNATSFVVVL